MTASPWDHTSRKALRVGIAGVAAVDAIAVSVTLLQTHPGPLTHPDAPRLFLALGGNAFALAPLYTTALIALGFFAAGRRPVLTGLLALASIGWMVEAHAALVGGPMRVFFHSGAVLAGWLFGRIAAWLHARSGGVALDADRLAEHTALGALAATYFCAAASKLILDGAGWFEPSHLQGIVASHAHVEHAGLRGLYATAIIEHRWFASSLAALTLIIQLGAPLALVGPRLRILCGVGILAFHLNVWLLTNIPFPQASVLVALLCFPWPAWIARARRRSAPEGAPIAEPRLSVRAAGAAALIAGAPLAFAFTVALPGYTALHHRGERRVFAIPDGLAEGAQVGTWRVERVQWNEGQSLEVRLAQAARSVSVEVTPPHPSAKTWTAQPLPGPSDAALTQQERDALIQAILERAGRTP